MTKKVTISVPDDIYEKMDKWRDSFNFSKVFQETIGEKIRRKEDFRKRLKGETEQMEQIVERLKREKYESEQNYFEDGKLVGLTWAKNSHFDHIMVMIKEEMSFDFAMETLEQSFDWDELKEREVGDFPYGYYIRDLTRMPSKWKDGFREGVQEFWNEVEAHL